MAFSFNETDINVISKILCEQPENYDNSWVWNLKQDEHDKPMIVSLYNSVPLGEEAEGSLVSVQTRHGYYELHDLTNFLIFEPDELIFIAAQEITISCLIVGKGNTCSLYANIKKELLNQDFSNLDPAVLLSAMQLSIVENML